jgi:hypothetical protein
MLTRPITADILYDLVYCPRRVALDAFGDPSERDEISPFVQILWERGSAFEKEVIASLKIPFLDLSKLEPNEREARTLEAMRHGEPLIYGGRIVADGLLGLAVTSRGTSSRAAATCQGINSIRAAQLKQADRTGADRVAPGELFEPVLRDAVLAVEGAATVSASSPRFAGSSVDQELGQQGAAGQIPPTGP